MKKFRQEFREFALRGNMLDLAIGIIIGSAVTAVVNSIVNDLINPFIGIFTGRVDFSNLFIALDGHHYDTIAQAEAAGAGVLKYGSFIMNVINFFIITLVVFLIVKGINKMRSKLEKPAEPEEPTTKICPFCQSEISIAATRCPHCTSILKDVDIKAEEKPEPVSQ